MKTGENFRDKLVKHAFSISGEFDEYKRQEVGRIGTNAFLMCIPLLLLGPFIAAFWSQQPETALALLMSIDAFGFIFIVCPYIVGASRRAHLTDHEIYAKDAKAARWHILWVALGLGIYFAVATFFLDAILFSTMDGSSLTHELTSLGNVWAAIRGGIFFGFFMGIVYLIRLKKYR